MLSTLGEGRAAASATEALHWMLARNREPGEVLFRGQIAIYPCIFPSLMRENISEEQRRIWWAVTRRFIGSRSGLTGYRIEHPHDALAVIQHYLVKSPVLDLTGTPEIALYFALGNPTSRARRIVYAVEAGALRKSGLVVTDHGFLALPLDDGGLKHRWLRQDGYTVGTPDWTTLEGASKLDFAGLPTVESFEFELQLGEQKIVQHLGDLESVKDDPLASSVRSHFESIAKTFNCLDIVQCLMPPVGTINAEAELIGRIEDMILRAKRLGKGPKELLALDELKRAASSFYWDTSWSAKFDFWDSQLGRKE
jgi:hypothetical protein